MELITELAAYIKILHESTMLETIYARNNANLERSKFWQIVGWACVIEHVHITVHQKGNQLNETPTVRGLAADNNNMQSVLMGNMETI